nr:reverse transcriptase domain-containing protein [Tanacetum cinerariifolium]
MSTRSSARNLFPPLDNPELTIRRRSRIDPTLLNDFEMATDRNGDPPDTSVQRSESSSSITSSFDSEIVALKAKTTEINKNLIKVLQINQQVKAGAHNCKTCGGPHSYNDCPATVGQTQNIYAAGAYQGGNSYQPQGDSHGQYPPPAYQASGYQALIHQALIPQLQVVTTIGFTNYMKANDAILKNMQTNMTSNTITNPMEDLKGITTQSGTAYQAPMIPTTSSSLPKVVKRETEVTKGTVPHTNNGSTKDVQPLVVHIETLIPNLEPVVASVSKTIVALFDFSSGRGRKDVFVKVGAFHFLADFVVVDFDTDPRLPLILERSFLKTESDLVDVYKGELTLQVLGFSVSGNLTPSTEPIVSNSSLTLTSFGESDFLLQETDVLLAIDDEPISPEIEGSYYDLKGDILLFEEFLNNDPSSPPLPPQEIKVVEPMNEKSFIDEPPMVELKELPPYLEYAFLEGDDKLPVIIAKDLKDEEKTALIKVLKSYKQALTWQLSDIKGIASEFCTHKILIEDDFKPAVQHQRRVNLKIHVVIKKEVLKLLDIRLIYPISDSPWTPKIKKRPHSHVLKECFPIVAFRLAYAMHRARSKGAENLADDHLSRLENPHQSVLEKKEINETFPPETLNVVEAKALPTNDARVVCKFLNTLFARFGTPRAIISDRGTHFCNDQFAKVMLKYGVTHSLATVYHPQTSGQVEVSNRRLKRILERTMGENHASWSDKIDDTLWAFHTAFKTPIECTPYKLVYGKACHLSIELEHKAY